jgi:primosomal protein N'
MLGTLKRAVTQRGGFLECRHCGTGVDWRTTRCPACGSRELAHYDL